MDCRTFQQRLEDLLDGRASAGERRDAEAHLEACPDCRELEELACAGLDAGRPEPPPDLAASILERTSGSPCESARERLCDLVDGTLTEEVDRGLLAGHTRTCEACAALGRTLGRLADELPALAALEPDPRFLADVLARTAPRPGRAARWGQRLGEGWQRLLQRPRIAWEGAYVTGIALFLAVGLPGAPLAGPARQALVLASVNPVDVAREPVARVGGAVSTRVRGAWQAGQGLIRDGSEEIVSTWTAVSGTARERLGTFGERHPSTPENDQNHDPAADSGPPDGE